MPRKKEEPTPSPDTSLDEKLQRLAECGIHVLRREALNRAIRANHPRKDINSTSYNDLLLYLPGESWIRGEQGEPISEGIFSIDTECVEDPGVYAKTAIALARLTHGDLVLDNVRDHLDFDVAAWLEFECAGVQYHWDWEMNGDWLDTSLFHRFAELLEQSGSSRRYCAEDLEGQQVTLICPTKEEFRRFSELTPNKFVRIGSPW